MLSRALQQEGLGPDQIRTAMNQWLTLGNDAPALLDIARRGGPVARLIRGAANAGPASGDAAAYADQVAGSLQDRATNLTRGLTPDTRPASEVQGDLIAARRSLADQQYAEPYAQAVEPTDSTMLALSGGPGRAALMRARSAAEAQMRPDQVAEIDQLLAGQDLPAVSAGTLDRIKIAMRERGDTAYQRGANDIGSGLKKRAGMIDESLDEIPGLQEARANYRNLSQAIQDVDTGRTILNASPEDFAPANQQAAAVGARQALTDAIGRPAEGATGTLNRIATAPNVTQNLETAFGDQAQPYQEAIGNEIARMRNARFIDSTSNSQTAGRALDEGLVSGSIPLSRHGLILATLGAIRNGATLTDAERQAIVSMGTKPLDDMDAQIIQSLAPYLQPRTPISALIAPAAAGAAGQATAQNQ